MTGYCIKMSEEQWSEVDRNRTLMCGVTRGQSVTLLDYIRDAINEYNKYMDKVIRPRVETVVEEVDEPTGFYERQRNGLRWKINTYIIFIAKLV